MLLVYEFLFKHYGYYRLLPAYFIPSSPLLQQIYWVAAVLELNCPHQQINIRQKIAQKYTAQRFVSIGSVLVIDVFAAVLRTRDAITGDLHTPDTIMADQDLLKQGPHHWPPGPLTLWWHNLWWSVSQPIRGLCSYKRHEDKDCCEFVNAVTMGKMGRRQ